ncbi:MAG: Dam family site-specific DNA-(adenine-N6)-methyltransferase [Desulfobulbus sp.]|nr:Dam family site-specific DNA-(adenine-N6)-methyltransferase [Desulfobulbus sp.]
MSNGKKTIKTKPFLKWAGGKRWFVTNHSDLFPQNFNRYIEPFLGSGAVFFHLQPHNAFLGDSNKELIDTYRAIQREWKLVYRYLRAHHTKHSKEYYYQIRTSQPISPAAKAARFIYLNRTCWNGLYRVNLSGVFNVPIGTKSTVVFADDNFQQVSKLLCSATLYHCDFEQLIDLAEENDLVFVDPPYTVRHNHNAFIKYNEKLFSWADQERLFASLNRARQRGVQIVATNAYHQCVRDLYDASFSIFAVKRNSSISSKIETRSQFNELVIYTEQINE